jgi:hypothetical protein
VVNAGMVNSESRVPNGRFSAEFFPFWAVFRTSKMRLNIPADLKLTSRGAARLKLYQCISML